MSLLRRLAWMVVVLACVLGVAGCSGSEQAKRHGAQEVKRSLEGHGFEVEIIFDRTRGDTPEGTVLGLLLLHDDLGRVEALVADSSADGAIGSEVSAWVFDSTGHADSFQVGGSSRFQSDNVVVLTRPGNEAAVRGAIEDLS